jgi:hypothetical protein
LHEWSLALFGGGCHEGSGVWQERGGGEQERECGWGGGRGIGVIAPSFRCESDWRMGEFLRGEGRFKMLILRGLRRLCWCGVIEGKWEGIKNAWHEWLA